MASFKKSPRHFLIFKKKNNQNEKTRGIPVCPPRCLLTVTRHRVTLRMVQFAQKKEPSEPAICRLTGESLPPVLETLERAGS